MKRAKSSLCLMTLLCLISSAIARAFSFFFEFPSLEVSLILMVSGAFFASLYVTGEHLHPKGDLEIEKATLIVTLLLSSLFVSILLQNIIFNDRIDYQSRSSLKFSLSTLTFGTVYFLVGAATQNAQIKSSKLISFTLILILIAGIVFNLDGGPILNFGLMSSKRSDEFQLDHLVIGEPAILLLALSLAFSTRFLKIPIFLIGVACFFALGGRTSLIAFVVTVPIYLAIRGKLKHSALGALFVSACFAVVAGYLLDQVDNPLVARMLLADGLSSDESKQARDLFLTEGFSGLGRQALAGDPTYIVEKFGTIGAYSHNLLSAWQFFGFIPFSMLLFSILFSARYIAKNKTDIKDGIDDFGLVLFIFSSVSVATGKAIMFYPFWLSIGFWLYRARKSSLTEKYGPVQF